LSGFNETLISRQIFEKYSNIKFHGNPSSGAELFHADRQTDVTKLTVAFRNFANTPNNMLMHTQTVNMCGSNCRLWRSYKTHKFGVRGLVQHLVDCSNGRAKRQHVSGGLQATSDRRNVTSHAVAVNPRKTRNVQWARRRHVVT